MKSLVTFLVFILVLPAFLHRNSSVLGFYMILNNDYEQPAVANFKSWRLDFTTFFFPH